MNYNITKTNEQELVDTNRNIWIDYLRSAITVLVVAHHSTLAYTTFAKFDKEAYIRSTNPIVDTKRWVGLDIFQNFNDVFFMSLMFLIGGLFLVKSIKKKGALSFIKDRFNRLFIPFIFLGTLLMLIAYFPSYYIAHNSTDIKAYIIDFFLVEKWPVGPPWFIWILFLFNLIFAFIYLFYNKQFKTSVVGPLSFFNKPLLVFIVYFIFTWILYVPIAYSVGASTWTGFGPFDFQLSRILLYLGNFMLGVLIGNSDFNKTIFSKENLLVKRWWIWTISALAIYIVLILIAFALPEMVNDQILKEFYAWMIYYSIYVASCVISCLAFITIFRMWVNKERVFWNSLAENAYLIYLVHYIFVVWIQFSLLTINIPALFKFAMTFIFSLAFSWKASILLRKISVIRRYL